MLCGKLAVDVDHARFAGWVRATFLDPIEVWDRFDRPGDDVPKRHYFSAYRHGTSEIVSHIAVAVATGGRRFVTAFPKAGTLDGRRNGQLVFRSYVCAVPALTAAPRDDRLPSGEASAGRQSPSGVLDERMPDSGR
jgi:hypothetical protein